MEASISKVVAELVGNLLEFASWKACCLGFCCMALQPSQLLNACLLFDMLLDHWHVEAKVSRQVTTGKLEHCLCHSLGGVRLHLMGAKLRQLGNATWHIEGDKECIKFFRLKAATVDQKSGISDVCYAQGSGYRGRVSQGPGNVGLSTWWGQVCGYSGDVVCGA